MNSRGISKLEVWETILKGQKKHQKNCSTLSKHRLFAVVYKKEPCHYFGITTYYIEK